MSVRSGNIVCLGRVQVSDVYKFNLFNFASEGKSKKIEQLFSSGGCDLNVDATNSNGQTALFVSCLGGHLKCAVILLELGANPNRRSDDGSTAVHAAVFSCSTSVLRTVVAYGGDLRLHDDRDLSPKDWGVEAGTKRNKKILELIEEWQNTLMNKIALHKNSSHITPRRMSSLSFSRSIHLKSSGILKIPANHYSPTNHIDLSHKTGYGDLISMSSLSNIPGQAQYDVGYLSLMPIINKSNLTTGDSDSYASYQAPPYFLLNNGCWGNQQVTLKVVKKMQRNAFKHLISATDLLIAELNISRLLHHHRILLLLGVCLDYESDKCSTGTGNETVNARPLSPRCFVYERVSLGSLYHLLHEESCEFLLTESVNFLLQIEEGLSYLHQRGLIHCCLSSHAISIVDSHTAKLSDFYYATFSEEHTQKIEVSPIFNPWLSPEVLAGKRPSFESDVFSFCTIVCEIFSGKLPWHGFDPESIRHHVVNRGKVFSVPLEVPYIFHPILTKGLLLSRSKRTVQLKEVTFVLRSILKSDSILAMEKTMEGNHAKDGLCSCDGDVGFDVPDGGTCQTMMQKQLYSADPNSTSYLHVSTRSSRHNPTSDLESTFQTNSHNQCKIHAQPGLKFENTYSSKSLPTDEMPNMFMRQTSQSRNVSLHYASELENLENANSLQRIFKQIEENDNITLDGDIHPDLHDTDSVNSYSTGYSDVNPNECIYEPFDSEKPAAIILSNYCATTEGMTGEEGEEVGSTKAIVRSTFDSDKMAVVSKPYFVDEMMCKRNVADCSSRQENNNIATNHLVSNMIDDKDACARVQSLCSLTSSYLSPVYPSSPTAVLDPPPLYFACNTGNMEEHTKNAKHNQVEHQTTNEPQVMPRDLPSNSSLLSRSPSVTKSTAKKFNSSDQLDQHGVERDNSQLHTSWQKVHDSLVEISKLCLPCTLSAPLLTSRSDTAVYTKRNECMLPLVHHDRDDEAEIYPISKVLQNRASKGSTKDLFPSELADASVVSSDLGNVEAQTYKSDFCYEDFIASDTFSPKIVALKTLVKKGKMSAATEEKVNLSQRQPFKLITCTHEAHPTKPEQQNVYLKKQSNSSDLNSNPEKLKADKSVGTPEYFSKNLEEIHSELAKALGLRSEKAYIYESESDYIGVVPYPSAFKWKTVKENPDLETLFSQFANRCSLKQFTGDEQSSKRFSISSEDLESIFCEFAERHADEYRMSANQLQSSSTGNQADVFKGQYCCNQKVNEEKNAIKISRSYSFDPKKTESSSTKAGMLKISRSSQTVPCDLVDDSRESSCVHNDLWNAAAVKSQFGIASESAFGHVQTSKDKGNVQELGEILAENTFSQNPSNKIAQFCQLCGMQVPSTFVTHVQAIVGNKTPENSQVMRNVSSLVSPEKLNDRPGIYVKTGSYCIKDVANKTRNHDDIDKAGEISITPSKLSFHHKLSIFECQSTENVRNPQPQEFLNSNQCCLTFGCDLKTDLKGLSCLTDTDDISNIRKNVKNYSRFDEKLKVGKIELANNLNRMGNFESLKVNSDDFKTTCDETYAYLNVSPLKAFHNRHEETGLKTSTPVLGQDVELQEEHFFNIYSNDCCVRKDPDRNDQNASQNQIDAEIKVLKHLNTHNIFNDRKLTDTALESAIQQQMKKPFLQVSSIPRCHILPDVRTKNTFSMKLDEDLFPSTEEVINSNTAKVEDTTCVHKKAHKLKENMTSAKYDLKKNCKGGNVNCLHSSSDDHHSEHVKKLSNEIKYHSEVSYDTSIWNDSQPSSTMVQEDNDEEVGNNIFHGSSRVNEQNGNEFGEGDRDPEEM